MHESLERAQYKILLGKFQQFPELQSMTYLLMVKLPTGQGKIIEFVLNFERKWQFINKKVN